MYYSSVPISMRRIAFAARINEACCARVGWDSVAAWPKAANMCSVHFFCFLGEAAWTNCIWQFASSLTGLYSLGLGIVRSCDEQRRGYGGRVPARISTVGARGGGVQ